MRKPLAARYRTTNWSACNAALRKRGSLLIWLDKEMIWHAPRDGGGRAPSGILQCCHPVLPDDPGSVQTAPETNGRDGGEPVAAGRAGTLARARLLHPLPQAEDPGRPDPLGHPPLPRRHHRARSHRDHPDPQERTALERGLPGCSGPQRHSPGHAIPWQGVLETMDRIPHPQPYRGDPSHGLRKNHCRAADAMPQGLR